MKLIIAGGRDYFLSSKEIGLLDKINSMHLEGVSEVVSGGASGVDSCGEQWAKNNGIKIRLFMADWKNEGKKAGPIRNKKMASYADAVALFKGGKGTESMYQEAKKAGLLIFDFRAEK